MPDAVLNLQNILKKSTFQWEIQEKNFVKEILKNAIVIKYSTYQHIGECSKATSPHEWIQLGKTNDATITIAIET